MWIIFLHLMHKFYKTYKKTTFRFHEKCKHIYKVVSGIIKCNIFTIVDQNNSFIHLFRFHHFYYCFKYKSIIHFNSHILRIHLLIYLCKPDYSSFLSMMWKCSSWSGKYFFFRKLSLHFSQFLLLFIYSFIPLFSFVWLFV